MKYFQEYEERRNRYSKVQPETVWKHKAYHDIMCKIVSVNLSSKIIRYKFREDDDNFFYIGSIDTLIRYYNLVENTNEVGI